LGNPVTSSTVDVLEHYRLVRWRGAPLDEPTSRQIRSAADALALEGAAQLLDVAGRQLSQVTLDLAQRSPQDIVQAPWAQWSVTLADFLLTRLLEIVVHVDDLAVSVGITTPPLADDLVTDVLHLLVDLAADRHGPVPVLRGLARTERAPTSIAAL